MADAAFEWHDLWFERRGTTYHVPWRVPASERGDPRRADLDGGSAWPRSSGRRRKPALGGGWQLEGEKWLRAEKGSAP
jgi:hypothetical protein